MPYRAAVVDGWYGLHKADATPGSVLMSGIGVGYVAAAVMMMDDKPAELVEDKRE